MLNREQLMRVIAAELSSEYKDEDMPVGVHSFSSRVTLEVSGSIIQGEEGEYTPTADISLLAVLARFAQKAGVVGPRLLDMLTESCLEAFEAGEPTGDYIEHTKEALRMVRERVTKKLPLKKRKGALRRACMVTVAEVASVVQPAVA